MIRHGIGVSPGFAYGPLHTVAPPVPLPADPTATGTAQEELDRAVAALRTVGAELTRRADAAGRREVTTNAARNSASARSIAWGAGDAAADRLRHPVVQHPRPRAPVRARRSRPRDVWVMAPMIATFGEAARFRDRCRAAGLTRAGVMIEIPAAALQAPAILSTVDFLSIGTNDLSQYTFAADRQCGELADLLDPWQPALLSLVATCARAGQAVAKPVGVCGEAAADPLLAPVLVGLGVSSLSMAPPAISAVRQALASCALDQCRRLAATVLAAADATAARALAAQASGA